MHRIEQTIETIEIVTRTQRMRVRTTSWSEPPVSRPAERRAPTEPNPIGFGAPIKG
jgi:hypothetical protein